MQVLELTQGQQVEVEILTLLVQQMLTGRQDAGVHAQDLPSEPAWNIILEPSSDGHC